MRSLYYVFYNCIRIIFSSGQTPLKTGADIVSAIKYSNNELKSSTESNSWKFTAGYLKNIKYIELGAGLYFQQTRQEKQNDSNENLMMNYGLVFTSSVKY